MGTVTNIEVARKSKRLRRFLDYLASTEEFQTELELRIKEAILNGDGMVRVKWGPYPAPEPR